jgi:hypothetical protein
LSSAKIRSGATRARPPALAPTAASVAGSISRSSSTAWRTARSVRSGSCASEVGAAAVWVEQLAAAERLGHRVDREVALREVGVDAALVHAHEVDVPGVPGPHHAPRAERAGELERRPARRPRELSRGGAGVALHRDVDVVGVAAEQPVADRSADDPRRAAREGRARRLQGRAQSGTPSRWCTRGTRAEIAHVIS